MRDFFDLYFDYVGITEVPKFYNRWCPIVATAAMLGRQCWFQHGHWTIYPNMYVMLIGEPAARKTTAINLQTRILKRTGYDTFSADHTSMERFIYDLKHGQDDENDITGKTVEDLLDLEVDTPNEGFITADEFTDFVGKHNLVFLVALSRLYDNLPEYKHPKLHGKSIKVENPTVNILSASQPEMLYSAFPPEAIGQGVMSRFIMVYGEATGLKVTFPKPPTQDSIDNIVARMVKIRTEVRGEITLSNEAAFLINEMYQNAVGIDDYRFAHYNNRRFTHLLKLSMLFAAMDCRNKITVHDALKANTLLYYTEIRMPRALGEFGKSKNSDVANKVISLLKSKGKPMTLSLLFNELSNDVETKDRLIDILKNMQLAGKVKSLTINGKSGYVPNFRVMDTWKDELLDPNFLTAEEKL